jgi:protein TonB
MSANRMIGIGIVILLHVFLVYALVSGLASSAIDVIKKPLEIKIIQAVAPPPPPPEAPPPPPPQLTTPPPPYIPPPLIQVQQPPTPPVFAVTTTVKPTTPTRIAPPPPAASVTTACPNVGAIAASLSDSFQQLADNDGINTGSVVVEFSLSADGQISNAHIISASIPDLAALALQGVRKLRCTGQGQPMTLRAPFSFQTN